MPISGNLEENKSTNSKGSILDHQIDTSIDQVSVSQTSRNMVGLTKRKSGRYGVKVYDRIRKKDIWVGTFDSPEEASKVYRSKKEELEKEFEVHASKIAKVCDVKRTSEYVGVSKRTSGRFVAHIRDPIRRKKLHLGDFDSEEEASKVYLAKKAELEIEAKGKEGVRWVSKRECRKPTSNQIRKRRKIRESGRYLEDDHTDSCLDTLESPMEIQNFDYGNGERASGGNNLSVLEENNGKPCSEDNQESSKDIDHLDSSILGENNDNPCSEDNQEPSKDINPPESSILVENNDTPCIEDDQEFSKDIEYSCLSHEEYISMDSKVAGEDLIQKDGAEEEFIIIDSSVQSLVNEGTCSDTKILLRTMSGTPVMDSNGVLLGQWSWIDDLSLPSSM